MASLQHLIKPNPVAQPDYSEIERKLDELTSEANTLL